MDVLNADVKWIGDRCYRLLRVLDSAKNEEDDDIHSSTVIQDDDEYDPDLPILHQGNKFFISIHVPAQLFCHIYGKKGRMREALEQYGAKVNIPNENNSTAGITVSGSTKKIVSDTYHKIENIVFRSRFKRDATHFVSVPVNSPEIKESFVKFKNEVLEKYKMARGLEESIFQNPDKLHVTIIPVVLLDERDTQNAIAILKNCADNILEHINVRDLSVHIKGIEYMNDDPAEVDVLYAKLKELDDDNRLQIIADTISNEFVKQNLAKSQHDNVKLHITIMNTLFRKQQNDESRETFDARGILKDFSDYEFGKIALSEVHLSIRYTTAEPSGYYAATHKIKLNK